MKKYLYFFILMSSTFIQSSAQISILGKIVNAETGTSIPYAHITTSDGIGTSSNLDGEFEVLVHSVPQTLKVSHISFQTKKTSIVRVDESIVIQLKPASILLQEIVIDSRNVHKIIRRALDNGFVSTKDIYKGQAFYRQVTKTDLEYNEIIEAFFDGSFSSSGVQKLAILNGRSARKHVNDSSINESYPFLKNFFYISMVPVFQKKIKDVIFPLNIDYTKFYEVDIINYTRKDSGLEVIVISFTPKTNIRKPAFEGDVYIDTKNHKVISLKGKIKNDLGLNFNDNSIQAKNVFYDFDITFRINDDEALLLDYIHVRCCFDYIRNGSFSKDIIINSHLFV